MLCLGHSFATVVMCVACVFISIMPIKTTYRSDRQLASGLSAERREGVLESGQNTNEVAGNEANGGQATRRPGRWPISKAPNVNAVPRSGTWPKTMDGHTVIPFFLGGYPPARRPNITHINAIFNYISDKTCVTFKPLPPAADCYKIVREPTVCAKSDRGSDACFSDDTGYTAGTGFDFDGAPQILHMPVERCPFHEGVQSVAKMLGLLPEHRRSDRDDTLKVTVTAAGTDRLLFAQGQTSRCSDYEDDSPLDLFSVSGFDTSASTLRHGSPDGMRAIEHGMVMGVRNIRHQWVLDYKRQRNMGLSFYDQRDLVRAYNCEHIWRCAKHGSCDNGGFRDRHCRCVCSPGFSGETCSERPKPSDEDPLNSNCSTLLRSQFTFTLADIGLQYDGSEFYACDITLVPPGCMRTLVQVNTSSLRPLKSVKNWDYQDSNWCELYFTLLLKHSVMGWRTFCLDYFFNEETLLFMSHASIEQTYGYIKMRVPHRKTFPMIANIVFNITFVEVPECGKKGARDRGGAVIKIHSYTVMTAVFCYFAGAMLGVVGWLVMRGLCMSDQDEFPSRDGSPASSGSSSYESLTTPPMTPLPLSPVPPPPGLVPSPLRLPLPPTVTPTPVPQPPPQLGQPPTIRLPTPEIRAPPPDAGSAPPAARPPPSYPPGARPQSPGDRRPPTGDRRPPPGRRPPPQQELHLPPIGDQGQRLSPRQGGLRASFVHWGGAALNTLRVSFALKSRAPQGESRPPQQDSSRPPPQGGPRPPPQGRYRPPPQGGSRRPPQGGSRPPPQGGSRPPPQNSNRPPPQNVSRSPGARPPQRYKTSPSRPGARRAPP